ncbi:nuclear transport factor 2 family protein [Pseudomonas sp. GM48]|uniref:nuclear transport factor 2 family protein n=1 Tax=Pseudomonas sp. GM48 TaxID=1144330 RepID=UPI0002701FF9|nr:nuclear transport factor 2 family protein [Pseudomonas sp. GM48]EJM62075.1 hypothetical protein PMI28_00548 [Pseudomonas sp. GM48]
MKFHSTLLGSVLLASLASAASAAPANASPSLSGMQTASVAVDINEYEAIEKAIGLYIEGGRQGKSSVMKPAFHASAVMYGGPGESVEGGPIKGLFEYIDSHPAAPDLNAHITNIEVQNQVAFARIESDNWNGARYSDMFLLVKDNGSWKILTKVFHHYDADGLNR